MAQKIHFVAIGGIGVSALAQYYLSEGWRVSGSDAAASSITDALKKAGVAIFIGHSRAHVRGAARVVYSAAVPAKNPELLEARRRGIPTLMYAEAVGELTRGYYTIAVSGSHGKSTTTALIGAILLEAKFDPTIIVGTKLAYLGGSNFRKGRGKYLVLEADEWNRSFHAYTPDMAVLTNIDRDHLDTYKTFAGVVGGFRTYLNNVKRGGYVVANMRDAAIRRLVAGMPKAQGVHVVPYNEKPFARHRISIPGAHNQLNAEAAWQATHILGIPRSVAERAFSKYKGAWRRLERIAPRVYTDYAHHPTEIKATLLALREKYPKKKILCVFQPHQQDRLNRLFKEFTGAFRAADKTFIVPLYYVKGREHLTGRTSRDLVRAINKKEVHYAAHVEEALEMIRDERAGGAVVVFMSAGDLDEKIRRLV